MNWIRDKYTINCDLEDIFDLLRLDSDSKILSRLSVKDGYTLCSCPFHKNGVERHPSMGIVNTNDGEKEFGVYHCFTCGAKGNLEGFVAKVLECDKEDAVKWLIDNFGELTETSSLNLNLEPIELDNFSPSINTQKKLKLDYTHPYLSKRKLDINVCREFGVGYEKDTGCIVFPVFDEEDNFCFNTRRSIYSKKFIIDKGAKKPIYLLNEVLKKGYKEVYICESQINALTLWSWGYPAGALIGTGAEEQYEILNKSPFLKINLCLDGDNAGKNGTLKLIRNLKKRFFIDVVKIPAGKDVNDLSKSEFDSLPRIDSNVYYKQYCHY